MGTPEKTLKNYFDSIISKAVFDTEYWDLNEFCKIYYGKIWENANEADKKEQLSIIQRIANKMVASHKDLFSKLVIKDIKEIEKNNDTAKYRVVFEIKGLEIKGDSYTDFILKNIRGQWKIINYEKIKYADKEMDTAQVFSNNLSTLMQNLGYKSIDEIELKVINEFIKNSFEIK